MKDVLQVIAAERIPKHSTGFLYPDEVNEILDRIEAAVQATLPPIKPVLVESFSVNIGDGKSRVIQVPQHNECPKCGLWVTRDYRVCPHGCCSIDWSEGGEA
ncbi:MAG: hypothetical protein HGA87_02655 [Desulfobulbaceae bacterium]|nr:hypothetical protein [Desulfobulbaceae bacterium]